MILEGHAWKLGAVSPASFTSADEIRNFPVQSDQPQYIPWFVHALYPEKTRLRRPLSQVRKPDGWYGTTFIFPVLTFGMYGYLLSTFFSTTWSTTMTVKLFDEDGTAIFLQGLLHRPPRPAEVVEKYSGLGFEFNAGVIVT